MGCGISGLKQENGMQIYNDGEPAPPGWGPTYCCMKLFTVTGIPEGTPRVPEAEEKEILARWAGTYKIVPLSTGGAKGNVVAYTDAHIEGNIMSISGGMHNATQYVGDRPVTMAVANQPQQQRIENSYITSIDVAMTSMRTPPGLGASPSAPVSHTQNGRGLCTGMPLPPLIRCREARRRRI